MLKLLSNLRCQAWLMCSFLINEVMFTSHKFGQQPPLIPESCKLSTKKWSRRYVTCTESDSGRLAHTAFHTTASSISRWKCMQQEAQNLCYCHIILIWAKSYCMEQRPPSIGALSKYRECAENLKGTLHELVNLLQQRDELFWAEEQFHGSRPTGVLIPKMPWRALVP